MYKCIGGSRGRAGCTPSPMGPNSFIFCIHFHRQVPTSEVHARPMGARPPIGNPGSATEMCEGCYPKMNTINSSLVTA